MLQLDETVAGGGQLIAEVLVGGVGDAAQVVRGESAEGDVRHHLGTGHGPAPVVLRPLSVLEAEVGLVVHVKAGDEDALVGGGELFVAVVEHGKLQFAKGLSAQQEAQQKKGPGEKCTHMA